MRKIYGRDLIVTIRPKGLYKLKLAYAIEIGAYLAYMGHYKRSKKKDVLSVARDELTHMVVLKRILAKYNSAPSKMMNLGMLAIGTLIKWTCPVTPLKVLDWVAGSIEAFKVGNYYKLAIEASKYRDIFANIAHREYYHELYFKGVLSSPKRPRGFLVTKSQISDEQIKRLRESWHKQLRS